MAAQEAERAGPLTPATADTPVAHVRLRDVLDPDDPDVAAVAQLLAATFGDPDVVLSLDRLREFLGEPREGAPRRFHVVIARTGEMLSGAVIFSYVPAVNCGFSEYITVAPAARGHGVARRLFARRHHLLDADARRAGFPSCRGLFVEAENPGRTPAAVLEAERESAMDPAERLRFFDHLGFRRVDVAYVQPPLAAGKQAVTYLDLLFLPWERAVEQAAAVPAAWVAGAVRPIWQRWSPETYDGQLATLRRRLGAGTVPLRPLGARGARGASGVSGDPSKTGRPGERSTI